jgi:hypothetical protein
MKAKAIFAIVSLVLSFGALVTALGAYSLSVSTATATSLPGTSAYSSSVARANFSGILQVYCIKCLPSLAFAGSIDETTAQGSNEFSVQGDGSSSWSVGGQIVSWSFQNENQNGTLTVTLTLDNGTTVFNQTTTASYGVVSGSWSAI